MVQMNRFFWKKASEVSNTQATKAKILKSVNFSKDLDVFPYCTEELKKKLNVGREYEKKKIEEEKIQDLDKFEKYK